MALLKGYGKNSPLAALMIVIKKPLELFVMQKLQNPVNEAEKNAGMAQNVLIINKIILYFSILSLN